jgi:hypothetical protein
MILLLSKIDPLVGDRPWPVFHRLVDEILAILYIVRTITSTIRSK